MSYETILVEQDGPILTVTLNRPPMNPINRKMEAELRQMLGAEGVADSVRAIILTGGDARAFSAGADITEFAEIAAKGNRAEVIANAQQFMMRVEAHPKPIIAAINGYAFGGGCELAMACHLRVMAEDAQIALPEVRLGIVPAYGGTQMLPRLIGKSRALQMILLSERIGAQDALQFGFANRVAPKGKLMDVAREVAVVLATQAPLALSGVIRSVTQGMEMPVQEGLALEREMAAISQNSEDAAEGAAAFFEKREPQFTGR